MKKNEKALSLTPGSIYKIVSSGAVDESNITQGVYHGLTTIGQVDALCIELDASHGKSAGKIRFVPCDAILYIDVITSELERERVKEDPTANYFG